MDKECYETKVIGYIYSAYGENNRPPHQGLENSAAIGSLVLKEEYIPGAAEILPGKKYLVLFIFHLADEERIFDRPQGKGELKGIFSTRSPFRPNHIGLSEITVVDNDNSGKITFTGVDMYNATPVIDIKPSI